MDALRQGLLKQRTLGRQGLLDYAATIGINWAWLSCDGATGKAPLGGQATGPPDQPSERIRRV